jgi:hypothetical protein
MSILKVMEIYGINSSNNDITAVKADNIKV